MRGSCFTTDRRHEDAGCSVVKGWAGQVVGCQCRMLGCGVVDPWCPVRSCVCASCVVAGGGMAGAAGKSTVCIVLTDENTEDSNVRMNKVRC